MKGIMSTSPVLAAQPLPLIDLATAALTWPDRAKSLNITDGDTLEVAASELLAVRALQEQAHATLDPMCKGAYDAWQINLGERKKVLDPLESAERIYKQKLLAWDQQEQARVREEQRLLEAAQIAQAEVILEAEIEHAEAAGASVAEIESIIDRPLAVIPVMAAPIARPAGISKPRDNWKGQISDKRTLVEFIVKNQRWELLSALGEDTTACNSLAKALKGSVQIPGLRFYNDPNIAARR